MNFLWSHVLALQKVIKGLCWCDQDGGIKNTISLGEQDPKQSYILLRESQSPVDISD